MFTGCNIENVSFGLSIRGERVALFKAISEGYNKFNAIAISSDSRRRVFPCGACRQVLLEFSPGINIYVQNDDRTYSLRELLPNSFDSIN